MTSQAAPGPIPEGVGLLHIGPHKTGSTAIQDALHQARDDLAAQGVRNASATRHDSSGARWVTDRLLPGQRTQRARRVWEQVVAAFGDDRYARRVFSSEFLSDATDDRIDRILADLGQTRTHLVVTLRPMAKLLPSQYQQSVHRGTLAPYDTWLNGVLREPESALGQRFWRKHLHHELIRRWAERLGFDRVVAVVVDSADFSFVPHSFERLLGLTHDTLAARETITNRSYTLAEMELVRRFHQQARAAGQSELWRHRHILRASRYVKERTPSAEEARLYTPDWAVDAANEIGRVTIERLTEYGVGVLGDLHTLASVGYDRGSPDQQVIIDPEVATRFALGMALADNADNAGKSPPTEGTDGPAPGHGTAARPAKSRWRRRS